MGLPRLRGDGPPIEQEGVLNSEVAPPTRGWTSDDAAQWDDQAGCPAYAGMDPDCCAQALDTPWLPRLRGDGPCRR